MTGNQLSLSGQLQQGISTTREEALEKLIVQLNDLMTAEYVAAHQCRVDSDAKRTAWASRWRAIFRGKTKRRIMEAIDICFREHNRPFSTADFETVYRTCTRAPDNQALQIAEPASRQDPHTGATIASELKRLIGYEGPIRTRRNIEAGIWTREMEERWQSNAEAIGYGKKKEPYHTPGSDRACAYPHCSAGGTMTSSVTGSRAWYCSRHFMP